MSSARLRRRIFGAETGDRPRLSAGRRRKRLLRHALRQKAGPLGSFRRFASRPARAFGSPGSLGSFVAIRALAHPGIGCHSGSVGFDRAGFALAIAADSTCNHSIWVHSRGCRSRQRNPAGAIVWKWPMPFRARSPRVSVIRIAKEIRSLFRRTGRPLYSLIRAGIRKIGQIYPMRLIPNREASGSGRWDRHDPAR